MFGKYLKKTKANHIFFSLTNYSRDCKMSSSSTFSIRLMGEEDRDAVLSLLLNSFFRDEPLAKCLELGEPIEFAKNIINDVLHDQCSFVAYHIQTKELVGICLNEMKLKDDKHIINESNEKIDFILHFLNNMHIERNLFDQFKTNSLLHIFIINVDNNYRGYGLGSQLILATIEHAKKINIKGIYAEATNIYSFNSFKQQGFQVYHQINYIDYDQIRLANLTDATQNQCQLVARII
jgi:N-acetylglutamate synthase-like GNAT family acetyltransferase